MKKNQTASTARLFVLTLNLSIAGELPLNLFTKAIWGSWVLFTRCCLDQIGLNFISCVSPRSIFRLPIPLTLGFVWALVLVLISFELLQPEEPHPDFVENQSRENQAANSAPSIYERRRGTLDDIHIHPAIQPVEPTKSKH